MRLLKFRPLLAVLALAASVALVASIADARPRSSFGSRGSQTFSAPPSTATAPKATRPMERSMTQPGQPGSTASRTATAPNPAGGGFFSRPGFMGGLFAGFLGAGLLGMLMGNGFAGGLGGMASILGLLLQIGIIALIGYLVWTWWQRRSQPATATASGPMLRDYGGNDSGRHMGMGGGMGALGGGFGSGSAPAQRAAGTDDVGLTPEDFNTFEQTLGEVQTAYGQEDLSALRSRVTPEMLSYYSEELAANASRGVVNRISDIKLEQGDLAEAWREGNTDYATVAMRYSLNDTVVDQSGRVIEGGADEATEVWTFRRDGGGKWLVSAVQQTA